MSANIATIVPAGPLERRFARLRDRVLGSRRPIVWLRALPGAGKTRFLSTFKDPAKAASLGDWRIIDGESPDAVQAALAAGVLNGGPPRRVIVASNASEAYSRALLTPSAYGFVEVLDDTAFFLTAPEMQEVEGMYTATGGWPVLVDAWLSGRGEEIQKVLPDFLELEVLPHLPQSLVSALFGALTAPLAPAAVEYLLGKGAALHPLLRRTDEGTIIAAGWVRAALETLRARPACCLERCRMTWFTSPRRSAIPPPPSCPSSRSARPSRRSRSSTVRAGCFSVTSAVFGRSRTCCALSARSGSGAPNRSFSRTCTSSARAVSFARPLCAWSRDTPACRSEDWVKQSQTPYFDTGWQGLKYGFKWWLYPRKDGQELVSLGIGFGGQRLMVFPQEQMIVTFTGWDILKDPAVEADLVERVIPAVRDGECRGPKTGRDAVR